MNLLPKAEIVDGFLKSDLHGTLLAHVLAQQDRFTPAQVTGGEEGAVDETRRRVLKLQEIGPLRPALEEAFREVAPSLEKGTGTGLPDRFSLELEYTACGDAAHFTRHRDIPIGPDRTPLSRHDGQDRLLSAVLYFHRQPKGFEGGALHMLPWGDDDDGGFDIEPLDNRLVAFPSWAVHEVRPVSCPSGRFEDYRFGLNCWFCAPLGG